MMAQTDRETLERIAADVRAIREKLPVIEHRLSDGDRRVNDLEVRLRIVEAALGRLMAIAAVAGGAAGTVIGVLSKLIGR